MNKCTCECEPQNNNYSFKEGRLWLRTVAEPRHSLPQRAKTTIVPFCAELEELRSEAYPFYKTAIEFEILTVYCEQICCSG